MAGLLACGGDATPRADGQEVRVAVAANFALAHEDLARRFQEISGIRIETSLGATGALYAQIASGAPFDVFLAADSLRPALLEAEGRAVAGTRFTYAVGRLVFYAPGWEAATPEAAQRRLPTIRNLAIANPRTAPYGSAAQAVLEDWGLWDALEGRIVRGENVGQAFQFVASGAAEAGFVALSQAVGTDERWYWIAPSGSHPPLRQDAVLLRHGEGNAGARRFLEFLRTEEALDAMTAFGYDRP